MLHLDKTSAKEFNSGAALRAQALYCPARTQQIKMKWKEYDRTDRVEYDEDARHQRIC